MEDNVFRAARFFSTSPEVFDDMEPERVQLYVLKMNKLDREERGG